MAPINAGDPKYGSESSKDDPPSSSQQSGFSGKCVPYFKKKYTNAGLFKIIVLFKGSDFEVPG